jgi:hypothetical protein
MRIDASPFRKRRPSPLHRRILCLLRRGWINIAPPRRNLLRGALDHQSAAGWISPRAPLKKQTPALPPRWLTSPSERVRVDAQYLVRQRLSLTAPRPCTFSELALVPSKMDISLGCSASPSSHRRQSVEASPSSAAFARGEGLPRYRREDHPEAQNASVSTATVLREP